MDLWPFSQSHRQWVRVCVPGAGRCLHNFTLTHRGDVFGRFLLLASFVVRFPSGSAHTGNNISRNSSACKVKAKPTSISSSPSFGVRAFFLRDSDLDWSVFGKRRRRKRPRVTAGQMTINAKINLPSPARARAGSVCRRLSEIRAHDKSLPGTRSTKTENNFFVIGVRAGMHNQSLRFRWFGPPSGPSGFSKTVAFLSCSIKFRFARFCRQHHFR